LAEEINRLGGRIISSAEVNRVEPEADGFLVGYRQNGHPASERASHVVSSIPVTDLLQAIPPELGSREVLESCSLQYRDLICVFLAVNQSSVSRDTWTYYPSHELLFGRTHEPKNWSLDMAPPDHTSLAAEVFTNRGSEAWKRADSSLIDQALEGLEHVGILSPQAVSEAWLVRIENAYPVYQVGYAGHLQRVRSFLDRWPALHLVGRTGSFRYLNSDGVIEDALALVDWLSGKSSTHGDVSESYYVP
jgi:protoporphyrinogen oxidase